MDQQCLTLFLLIQVILPYSYFNIMKPHNKQLDPLPTANQFNNDILSSLFPLSLAIIFYPLKRIQSNHQIQPTYIKQQIKSCKQFFTRCTHHGIRSWFRGLTPYILKIYIPFLAFNYSQNLFRLVNLNSSSFDSNIQNFQLCALSISYLFIYPFENTRLRMAADVQRDRVYRNARDCLGKMKKVEGRFSTFKGFTLSFPYFLLQYLMAPSIYQYLLSSQKQSYLPNFMKKVSGVTFFISSCLISDLLLHPIDSMRKIIQINGAMNHNNVCRRYRDVLKFHNFFDFYRGFNYRILHSFFYYAILIGQQKKASIY